MNEDDEIIKDATHCNGPKRQLSRNSFPPPLLDQVNDGCCGMLSSSWAMRGHRWRLGRALDSSLLPHDTVIFTLPVYSFEAVTLLQ